MIWRTSKNSFSNKLCQCHLPVSRVGCAEIGLSGITSDSTYVKTCSIKADVKEQLSFTEILLKTTLYFRGGPCLSSYFFLVLGQIHKHARLKQFKKFQSQLYMYTADFADFPEELQFCSYFKASVLGTIFLICK